MRRTWQKMLKAAVRLSGGIFILCLLLSGFAEARELGHHLPGVINIRDLAVPAEAEFYYEQYNFYYTANSYKDRNGNSVNAVGQVQLKGEIDIYGIAPLFLWVTDKEILGGNYAFYISPSIASTSVSASASLLNRAVEIDDDSWGLGDIFVQPFWLGWRDTHYDLSFGLGLYAPIGKYDEDDVNNIGLGFWTFQAHVGGYYYIDKQQASALMLAVTYETHTKKDGTDITPGDHFTLEYGFSQYLSERLEVGITGYSQWQVNGDDGDDSFLDPDVKCEIHAVGGQVAYWVTPRLNLSLRYLSEYNAKARFEGDLVTINLTFLPKPLF